MSADTIPSNLLIRDFPPELAEKCLSSTGEKVLTRAVLACLYKYFELQHDYKRVRLHSQDLQSDIDQIISYFKFEAEVSKKRTEVLKLITDPDRFYLHGD